MGYNLLYYICKMKESFLSILFILYLVNIHAQQAGFTFSQPSKCAPSTVSFTNTSTGSPDSCHWNFDDGFSSPSANPTHPFTNAGIYTVTLTAYYPNNISNTYTQAVEVLPPPSFSFRKLNDSVCPGGSISFTSSVTYPANANAIRSYSWDFGDGGFSSAPNPTYQYMNVPNNPVLYPVSLTVTDTNGCNQKVTISNYIYVKPKPVIDFIVDKQFFCIPDTPVVTFTNQTTATTNNAYVWHFGDGAQSTLENPVHNYHGIGNYSVSLTATSQEGCTNTLSKPRLIEVINYQVKITASDTILCSVPVKVTFEATSSSTNNNYTWNFGDGGGGQSSIHPVTHTYNTSGTYTVTVIANSHNGACLAYDTIRVHVYDSIGAEMLINGTSPYPYYIPPPFPSGRMVPRFYALCNFQLPDPVLFENASPYSSTDDFGFGSTSWWFGDGDSARRDPAPHIFSNDTDRYSITMQTVTPYGCLLEKITTEIWFHSYIPPTQIRTDTIGGCAPLTLDSTIFYYTPQSWDILPDTFIWDWGDGSPLDTTLWSSVSPLLTSPFRVRPTPSSFTNHTYTDTGIYTIMLTLINEIGCPYTIRYDVIPVGYPPKAGIIPTFEEACYSKAKTTFAFIQAFDSVDAQGNIIARAHADEWLWSDLDGFCYWTAEKDTTTLRVCDTGYQHIRMVPYHNKCPGDTVTMEKVAYVCPPMAGFTTNGSVFSASYCDYPVRIELDNTSRGATAYKWFLGDAVDLINQSTDTAKNPPPLVYLQSTPFLSQYRLNPGITITMVAYNDDSVDINSPTYNRCKFCTDTVSSYFIIYDGKTSLVHLPQNICQGSMVTFYDQGTYDYYVDEWTLDFYPQDPLNNEHTSGYSSLRENKSSKCESILCGGGGCSHIVVDPVDDYADIQKEGLSLAFNNMDNYRAVLRTIEFGSRCIRSDTIYFTVYPQSTPSFLTSKSGIGFTDKKDTLCANNPDILYLWDASYTLSPFDTAKITRWEWKMRKDSISRDSSTLQNTLFKDTAAGIYDISLHLVNEYGCISDSVFKEHVLVNKITTDFHPSQGTFCNHTPIEFNNFSYIAPYDHNKNTKLTCTWDWGDGTPPYIQTGTVGKIYHTYHRSKLPDTVYVTLTVSANGICSGTLTAPLIIAGPTANFTDDGHRFPCPGNGRKINFQSTSTGNPVWFYWNFGDSLSGINNESNVKDPIHDYLRAGTYDLTLIVKDTNKCADTLFVPKHVFIDGPAGNFQYGELSGCVDHRVVFVPSTTNTDSVIVNPDRANPITEGGTKVNDSLWYTYQKVGLYVPYFYLIKWTDNNGTLERCVVEWPGTDTVFVRDIIPDFKADSIYCSRSPVEFPNTTTLLPAASFGIDSTIWTFGNGDSLKAIDGYTQYDTVGIYNVNMIVYAKNCTKQITKPVEVIDLTNTMYTGPDSANTCGSNIEVNLMADSISGIPMELIPQYKWVFDDGEIIEGNPASRSFHTSGVYPYRVEITFGISNCFIIHSDTINIQFYSSPVAEFEAKPQTVNFGEEIRFIDKSSPGNGILISWYWNFGDSTGSSLQNPAHTYTNTSGYITVLLKIEDEFGCKDSIEHEVLILESLDFPNIFTPIGTDGKRYVFRPLEKKGYFKDFLIDIYNRWGNLIWTNSCTEPNCPDYADPFWWDGYNKSGELVHDGVYYWVVSATPLSGTKPLIKNGSVTVVGRNGK